MCHFIMKKIDDQKLLDTYLNKYHLQEYLQEYDPTLYSFDANETLNQKLNPRQFLLFLVSGTVLLQSFHLDGSISQLTKTHAFTCFGEMELGYPEGKQNIIKTLTNCTFIAIDIQQYQSKIENDPKLLKLLLRSVVQKIAIISDMLYETSNVQSRVLLYLENETKDHTIRGVEQLSQHLNCSRRQLQRVIKKMVDDGILEKKKKGVYVKK